MNTALYKFTEILLKLVKLDKAAGGHSNTLKAAHLRSRMDKYYKTLSKEETGVANRLAAALYGRTYTTCMRQRSKFLKCLEVNFGRRRFECF